jgi:phasin family protein
VHKKALEIVRRNAYCALQQSSFFKENHMADINQDIAKAAIDAPAKLAETVAETIQTVADESKKTIKNARAKATRRAKAKRSTKRTAATVASAKPTKTTRRAKTARRNTRTAARKISAAAQERIETVTKTNFFNGFDAVPAFAPFQSMFSQAGERGQDMIQRSQRVAEELADLTRANVEAMVEAGQRAAEGARTIGQDVVASGRDGVEQAADAIRSLAEAKSPTEYMQLQGDFARASFDRAVAETSKLTEAMVKLAGEAFQPISNRATANAERFNTLVA